MLVTIPHKKYVTSLTNRVQIRLSMENLPSEFFLVLQKNCSYVCLASPAEKVNFNLARFLPKSLTFPRFSFLGRLPTRTFSYW